MPECVPPSGHRIYAGQLASAPLFDIVQISIRRNNWLNGELLIGKEFYDPSGQVTKTLQGSGSGVNYLTTSVDAPVFIAGDDTVGYSVVYKRNNTYTYFYDYDYASNVLTHCFTFNNTNHPVIPAWTGTSANNLRYVVDPVRKALCLTNGIMNNPPWHRTADGTTLLTYVP